MIRGSSTLQYSVNDALGNFLNQTRTSSGYSVYDQLVLRGVIFQVSVGAKTVRRLFGAILSFGLVAPASPYSHE